MIQIDTPNIKGQSYEERTESIRRYLYSLAEKLNWALNTLEKEETEQKKKIEEVSSSANSEKTVYFAGVPIHISFSKKGEVMMAVFSGSFPQNFSKESGVGTIDLPDGFFNPSVDVATYVITNLSNGFSSIGKMTVPRSGQISFSYDFSSASANDTFEGSVMWLKK